MENQYNYYTTDQNMNTGNYGGGGGPGKETPEKKGKKGGGGGGSEKHTPSLHLEWLQVLHFRRVILWQEKFLVQHRQRIKQLRQQRPAMQN